MPYPAGTYVNQILDSYTRAELEQFYALLQGYLSTQHEPDGTHGNITAKSLNLIANTATGATGNLTADGSGAFDDTVTADADGNPVITGAVTSGASTNAGIDMRSGTASRWSWAAEQGVFSASPSLLLTDVLNRNASSSILGIVRTSAIGSTPAVYELLPPSSVVSLKLGDNSGGRKWAEVNASVYNGGESGSWTPALKFGGASTGMTYGTQTGSYLRICSLVIAYFKIVLTAKGSSTGAATITGVPYAAAATPPAPLDCASNMNGLTGAPLLALQGTTLFPVQTTATGRAQLDDTHFTNTSDLRGLVVYLV